MAEERKNTQSEYNSYYGSNMDSDYNSNTDSNTEEYSDNQTNMSLKDIQDIDLLTIQSQGQLILILGYYFEYIASQQAIEFIILSYAQKRYEEEQGIELSEEEEAEVAERWRNAGIDADRTALIAAFLELYGQTILTRIDYVKYQRFLTNTDDKDYTLAKTANWEIYTGAMLEELAYMFNLQGAQNLYSISNQNPLDD